MNGYRSYMDRVRLPETAHARLMKHLAAGERPARRRSPLVKYAPVGGEADGPDETPPEETPAPPVYIPVNFEGGMEMDASIIMPEGWFEVELSQTQLTAILGGEDGPPAELMWSGWDVTGKAVYKGAGELWRVALRGVERADGANSFEMTLRPGDIPEDCVVENTDATVINGAAVNGSRGRYGLEDGEGLGESRKVTFMARHVGVAFQAYNRDGEQAERLASLTANCYAGTAGADTPRTLFLAPNKNGDNLR